MPSKNQKNFHYQAVRFKEIFETGGYFCAKRNARS
jgi:hypothetical protein